MSIEPTRLINNSIFKKATVASSVIIKSMRQRRQKCLMKLHKENKTIRHFMETCRGLDKMMLLDESENQPHSLYPLLYPVTHIAPASR